MKVVNIYQAIFQHGKYPPLWIFQLWLLYFNCSDWFTQLQLSAYIPSHLIWRGKAPSVAELKKGSKYSLVGYLPSYNHLRPHGMIVNYFPPF